jgi:N-acetylmuramoyl-L-alanine amidase
MIAYLIKMILCSALLYTYYHLALRNKVFHQWNRFYLLAIVPLSVLIPLVRVRMEAAPEAAPTGPVRLLEVVSDGNERIEAVAFSRPEHFDPSLLLYCIYTVVGLLLLLHFARGILRLRALARRYPVHSAEGVDLVLAPVSGTPFTFFRRIFWNPAVDLGSDSGQQILQHELVHVREGHTADKLLMQATLSLCWFNPVFWILRNELHLVHEFIADQRSVKDQDASTLARLILQTAYPEQYSRLANPFFHHAIKRRLHMLNQLKQSTRVRYLGRVLALPLLAGIGFAFAVRTQSAAQTPVLTQTNQQKFTVVIDAGHGRMENGKWNGASYHGVSEDEIVLAVARKMAALNSDPNLELVFTRPDERIVDLHQRVDIAKSHAPDLFISLHVNASEEADRNLPTKKWSGIEITLSRDSNRFRESRYLGSVLEQSLKGIYKTQPQLRVRTKGVWVLDQAPCPAVLLELGYINNEQDFAFIRKEENQDRIAREIMNAISSYRLRPQASKENEAASRSAGEANRLQVKSNHEDSTEIGQKIAFIHERLAALKSEVKTSIDKKTKQDLINFLEERKKELQQQLENEQPKRPAEKQIETTAAAAPKSGDTLTLEQLKSFPIKTLLCPEGADLVSCRFTTDLQGGAVVEVLLNEGSIHANVNVQKFIGDAGSGLVTIENRMVRGKDGNLIKLPSLVYFVVVK